MPATPTFGLRYPASTDPADVPTDMQELATDVETQLTKAVLSNATPAANQVPVWSGSAWVFSLITSSMIAANAVLPAGMIVDFGGATAPTGWLLCDGSAVSRTTYATLFAAIGTGYGTGDGSTTFNLPDFRGRAAVGRDSGQAEFATLGLTGGAKTATLTLAQIPGHTHGGGVHAHTLSDPGHAHSISDPGHSHGVSDPSHGHSTGTESADHTHILGTMALTDDSAANQGSWVRFQNLGSGGILFYKFNNTGGRSAAHSHTVNGAYTGISINGSGTSIGIYSSGTGMGVQNSAAIISSDGGGGSHTNLQPYQVTNKIIKT